MLGNLHFGGGTGRWFIILAGCKIFLISPNFLRSLSFKSFSVKSFGNSYVPCLLLIIALHFTCGESKTS